MCLCWFVPRIIRQAVVIVNFAKVRHVGVGLTNGSGDVKASTFFSAIQMTADLSLVSLIVTET